MRLRAAVWLAIATTSCTHAQAPHARLAGEVMSLAGVGGLVASALTNSLTSHTRELLITSSAVSLVGILTFAVGDLTDPSRDTPIETLAERNRRWARILTERAAGAAREGNCARVHRLEVRVRTYDPDTHDFVLMRDPEIVRCLEAPPPADGIAP